MKLQTSRIVRWLAASVLLLASLILQVNLVYACQLMKGMPQEACRCEEMGVNHYTRGDDCGQREKVELEEPCCRVTVTPREDTSLAKSVTVVPPAKVYLKTFHPVFLIPVAELTVPVRKTGPFHGTNAVYAELSGSEIYLLTQRFRE